MCANEGCGNTFEDNAKRNQKYCSMECSVKANNRRSMERYNERKRIMGIPRRKCATVGCPTILRKTNTGEYCDPCTEQTKEAKLKDFRSAVLRR